MLESLAALAVFVASSLTGLNLDIGVLCFSFGAVLAFIDPAAGLRIDERNACGARDVRGSPGRLGTVPGVPFICALAVCASLVDMCPFSPNGATLVATSDEEQRPRMTSLLTRWGLSMIVLGPLVLGGGLVWLG